MRCLTATSCSDRSWVSLVIHSSRYPCSAGLCKLSLHPSFGEVPSTPSMVSRQVRAIIAGSQHIFSLPLEFFFSASSCSSSLRSQYLSDFSSSTGVLLVPPAVSLHLRLPIFQSISGFQSCNQGYPRIRLCFPSPVT